MGRLVQPQPAAQRPRLHPARRVRSHLLRSTSGAPTGAATSMKLATNPRRFTLLMVTDVGLLITGCDCGRRAWPRTQVRLTQPNRASTGAASTSKAAEVTVTAYRFYNEVGGVYDVLGL